MGLDNIPVKYACKDKGTAVLVDDRIDCEQTKSSGGCPYLNEKNSSPHVANIGGVLGMFGTDCWYRGKYGNSLLRELSSSDPNSPFDGDEFYGKEIDDFEGLTPEMCLELAHDMDDFAESWVKHVMNTYVNETEENRISLINDWTYASWWLKFVANHCDGSVVWY